MSSSSHRRTPRERLVHHVQRLEHFAEVKQSASENLADAFEAAGHDGFDTKTLKVVLKLRKMSPAERQERRALEAIYLAALGMLEGEALPEAARRRLDPHSDPPRGAASPAAPAPDAPDGQTSDPPSTPDADSGPALPPEPQPMLQLKEPEEAKSEGSEAAAAGKRIYDNPYPAGDPCRAAWDEGWCAQRKSHGMEMPSAFQRRSEKTAKGGDKKDGEGDSDQKRGAA